MPARLACVKPAASVRSEPGSNSQVGLETSNRLITTFDEVPPYPLNAIHIANNAISIKRSWCNLCKRVPPKSFVQPRHLKTLSLQVIETRKDSAVHVSLSSSSLVKQPGAQDPLPSLEGREVPFRRQMTTDCYRL